MSQGCESKRGRGEDEFRGRKAWETNETVRQQTLFAVPLSCDGCIKAVSDSLFKIGGITNVEGNLKDQLITVKGTGKSWNEIEMR